MLDISIIPHTRSLGFVLIPKNVTKTITFMRLIDNFRIRNVIDYFAFINLEDA